jgi:peptidoglycan L-alanyl-D-glutamate endopeptidase CwlK
MTYDERTERNISTLHPAVQPRAREFMRLASDLASKHGVVVRIISGLRSYAEQDALYAKGRTAPGPKVTNARAGFSNHNFGTAWDIGLFRGKAYLTNSPIYTEIGQAARSLGLTWGGDFKSFKDTPHYEVPTGLTLAQMRERVAAGKDIFA